MPEAHLEGERRDGRRWDRKDYIRFCSNRTSLYDLRKFPVDLAELLAVIV